MENKKIKIILIIVAGILVFLPKIIGTSAVSQKVADRPFDNLNLEAKAVLVFDLVSQKPIFEFNSSTQLPLASLTKIMTVVVAEETKTKDISKLVNTALMQSSNQAASALASTNNNFIDLMNKKADYLGLNQTYFLNETGLDVSGQTAGAYGSASDVAKLIVYALKNNPDLFEATLTDSYLNTNPFATTTTLLIASKTGLTDLAGGNLAIVFDAGFNHPVVSVVLGSSEKGRFADTQKLIEATFKYLTNL
jgi:serine-type D-Ala-D-Ala carboxypeptidase (penicillin-binding protein 5/6)